MGKFIVIEGIDGSGKSTQAVRLAEHLTQKNIKCLTTKEPTDGPIGSMARRAVCGFLPLSADALALLFAADRAEHIAKEIRPALKPEAGDSTFVVCDRYVYSNMAYQGLYVAKYNEAFLLVPDLTLFVDTDPEECTRRIMKSRANMEIYDGVEIAQEIRKRYFEAFRAYEDIMPVVVIDGNQPEDDVFAQILSIVMEK